MSSESWACGPTPTHRGAPRRRARRPAPPPPEPGPGHDELLVDVTRLRLTGDDPKRLAEQEGMLSAVEGMREANPMLGLRGVRLGIHMPQGTEMQGRAILEAARNGAQE